MIANDAGGMSGSRLATALALLLTNVCAIIHLASRGTDMMIREDFLELLRTDQPFREEVRRQLLTEDLLALPARFDQLTEVVGGIAAAVRDLAEAQRRTEETLQRHSEQIQQQGQQLQALIEAQQQQSEQLERLTGAQYRTEEALRQLADWQRGEVGRRDGERYERDTIGRAPALFNGGQGGAPDHPWVQQRLAELLKPLFVDEPLPREDDPFLADLVWWKGEQIAVVDVSQQVNGYDIFRAAKRAATLRRVGAQALAVVIGRDWAATDARFEAKLHDVEWKVGSDLSDGFLAFRRTPSG